jgi:hypothetical protein
MKKILLGTILLFSLVSFSQEKFTTTHLLIDTGNEDLVRSLGRNVKISLGYELTDSTLTFIQIDKVVLKDYQKNGYPIKNTVKIKLISTANLGTTTLVRVYNVEDCIGGYKAKYTIVRKEDCYSILTEQIDGFSNKYTKTTSINIDCKLN